MKKTIFILFVAISINVHSQIGTNPIIVPTTPSQGGNTQNVNVYHEGYIYQWLDIIVKDADYWKRQDNIAQANFDNNMKTINKAMEYYKKEDWASAVYYARDIRYTEYYEINNIKHFIMATSYFYLNDINNSKKWYAISSKKVDPETMRMIDDAISDSGMDAQLKADAQMKKDKKRAKGKSALIGGICATVGVIVTLVTAFFVISR